MIGVGVLVAQKTHYLQHTLGSLFAADESALYADNDGHHAESRPTDGHRLVIAVAPFARQSGFGMGKVPKVTECLPLNEGHQLVVGEPFRPILPPAHTERIQ